MLLARQPIDHERERTTTPNSNFERALRKVQRKDKIGPLFRLLGP